MSDDTYSTDLRIRRRDALIERLRDLVARTKPWLTDSHAAAGLTHKQQGTAQSKAQLERIAALCKEVEEATCEPQ